MTSRLGRYLPLSLLLLFSLGLYTWATYTFFTSRYNGGNDFFSRYVAWRAWLLEGRNPYSDEVTRTIQLTMNGRPALPGEDENALIYPWYTVLLQWPFVFWPWPWARAVYLVLGQVFVVAGLALTLRLLRWRLSAGGFALMAVWAILFYPEGRGIILGQIVITQYFLAVLALWLLHQKRDGWAGLCLALTTVRPPAVFLLVPYLLVYALARRRPRFVWSCLISLAVLFLAGFIFLPTWFTDWLYRMGRYPSYTVGQSPIWLLTHQVTSLGPVAEWGLTALCGVGLGWAWWLALRAPGDTSFYWGLGITLVVSNLIVPRSATTNYIFMLFSIYQCLAALQRTWPRAAPWVILLFQGSSLLGLWWLFAVTVQGDQEQPIMFIPQIIGVGLALLAGYRWLNRDSQRAGVTL